MTTRPAWALADGPVFDNWRLLHGRGAFTGIRRMAGGYSGCSRARCERTLTPPVNRDDWASRALMTREKRDDVLNSL